MKYRYHRAILVFFGSHRHFRERDFSGSRRNGEVAAPPPRLSLTSHFFFRENRARRLLRGGEGGGSARCVRHQLDVVELDLGEGVRAVTSGMCDRILRGELDVPQKMSARPRRLRRLLVSEG